MNGSTVLVINNSVSDLQSDAVGFTFISVQNGLYLDSFFISDNNFSENPLFSFELIQNRIVLSNSLIQKNIQSRK